jgi:hypothetical protein
MRSFRSNAGWRMAVLLALAAATASRAAEAQAPADTARAHKSVYGKLETVDAKLNGVVIRSDAGERLGWRFDRKVIAQLAEFKPGDPVIVIYRQMSPNDKAVTAIAFPGKAETPIYVNATGFRVVMRSAPMVDGVCSNTAAAPLNQSVLPVDGTAEILDECWCCAAAGDSCSPSNKSGNGRAILIRCFK